MPGASGFAPSAGLRARADHASMASRGTPPGRSRRGPAEAGDDGRFDADLRGAPVEHRIDAPVEIAQHVSRHRSGSPGPSGWRTAPRRGGRRLQQRMREGMGRHPQAHAVEARRGRGPRRCRWGAAGTTRVRGPGQNASASASAVRRTRPGAGGRQGLHMGDERVEARALLGGVDARHRLGLRGVGAEAVDRLGRERDEPARAQDRGRPLQAASSAARRSVAIDPDRSRLNYPLPGPRRCLSRRV
jgi:hypothetical protein